MIRLLPRPVKALTACMMRSRISGDLAPEQTTTAPVYSPRRFGSSESSAYSTLFFCSIALNTDFRSLIGPVLPFRRNAQLRGKISAQAVSLFGGNLSAYRNFTGHPALIPPFHLHRNRRFRYSYGSCLVQYVCRGLLFYVCSQQLIFLLLQIIRQLGNGPPVVV